MANPDAAAREAITIVGVLGLILAFSLITWARKRGNGNKGKGDDGKDKKNREKDDGKKGKGDDGKKGKDEKKKDRKGKDGEGKKGNGNGKNDGSQQPANTPASTDFDPNKRTDGGDGAGAGAGNLGQVPGTSRLTSHYTLDPELDISVTSNQPYKVHYRPGPPPPINTGNQPGGRGGPGGWYGGGGGPSSAMGGIMRVPQTASIPVELRQEGPFAPYGLPTGRPPQGYDIIPGDYARPVIRQPVTPIAIPAYQPYVGRAPSLVSPSSLSYGSSPTSISPLTPDGGFELRTAIMPEEFDPYTYASAQPAKSYFTSKELHQDPLDLAATNDNRERVEAGLNAKPGRRLSELLGIPGLGEALGPASDDRYNPTLFGELNQNPREIQTQAQNMVSPTRVRGPQYSPIDLEPRTYYTREEGEKVTNLSPLKPGGTETATELPGKAGEKAKQREKQKQKERLREGRRWDEVNGVYVSPKAVDLPTPLMGEGEKARKARKELNAEADDHERAKAKTKKERTKVPISPERGSNREKVKKMKKKRVKVLDPETNKITHEEVLVTDDESHEIDGRVSPTKPRRRVQIISGDGQSEGEEVYDKHGRTQREKVRRKVRIGSEDEYVTVDEDGRRIKKKNKKRLTLSEEEEDEKARTRRRNRAKGEDIYDSGEEELSKNRRRAKARREKVRNGRGGVDIDDEEEEDIYERVRGEDGRTRLRKRIPQRSRRRIDEADEYEEEYEVDRLQQGGQGRARRRVQQPYYQDEVPFQHVPFGQQQQQYLQQQQQQQPQLVQAEPILAQSRKVDQRVIEDEIARTHPGMSLTEREELARMRIQRIEAEQDKLNNREKKPVQHRSNGDGDEIEDAPIKPIRERKENQVEPQEISDAPGITRPGRQPRTQNELEERYPTGPDQRAEAPLERERIELSNDQDEIVKPTDEITLGHSERFENDQRREKIKEIEKEFMSRPMPTGPSNNRRPRRQLSDSKPPERPHEAEVREIKDNVTEPLVKPADAEVPAEGVQVRESPIEERSSGDRGDGITDGLGGSDHTVKPGHNVKPENILKPEHTEQTVKPEPHLRPAHTVKPENTVKPVELDQTVRPDENERSDRDQSKADEEEVRETVRRERENAEAPSWNHNARGEQRVERLVSPRGDSHRDTHDAEQEEEPAIRSRPKPKPETSRAPPAPREEHLETRHTSPIIDSGLSDYERWSKDDDEGMQGLLYAQRAKDKIRYGQHISEIFDSTKSAKPEDKESFCNAALDNWMLNRARLKARHPKESEESLLQSLVMDRLETEHYLAEGRERRGQGRPQPRPVRNDREIVSDQREGVREDHIQQREGQEIDAKRANIIPKDRPMEEHEYKQLIREVIDTSDLPKPEDMHSFCNKTFNSWKDKRSRLREKYPSKGDRALLRGHVTKCLRKEAENNGPTRPRPEANNHERGSQAPERVHEKPERRRKPRTIRENGEEERSSPTRDTSNAANGLRSRRGERRDNRLDALNGAEDREIVDVSNLNDEEIEEYERTGKIPSRHETRDSPAKVSRDRREKVPSGHTPEDAESEDENIVSKTDLQMATTNSGPIPEEDADIGAADEVSTKHRRIRKKQPMPISDRPEYTSKSKEDALSPTNGKNAQDTWDDPYEDGSGITGSKARPVTRSDNRHETAKVSSLDPKSSGYHSDEGYESAEVDLTEKHGSRGKPILSSIDLKISQNDNSRETDIFEHTASVKPSTYRGRREVMGDTVDGDSTQLSHNTRETEEGSGRGDISQHTDKIKLTRRKAGEDPTDDIRSIDPKERSLNPKDSNDDNTDLFEHTKDVNPTQGRFDEKLSKTSKIHTIVAEKDSGKPKAWPLDGEDPIDQFQKDLLRENQAPLQVHTAFVPQVDPIDELDENEPRGSTQPLKPPYRKGSKPPRVLGSDTDRSGMRAMGHGRRHNVNNDTTDKNGHRGESNDPHSPISPLTPTVDEGSQERSTERERRVKENRSPVPFDISPLDESYAVKAARVRRNKQEDSERRRAAGAEDEKVKRRVRVGSITEDRTGRNTEANQNEVFSPTETETKPKRRSILKTSNNYEEKVSTEGDDAPRPRQKRGVSISEDKTYIGETEIKEKTAQFEHSGRTTRGKENADVEIHSPKPRQKRRGVSFSENINGNEESKPKGRKPQAENRDRNTGRTDNEKPDRADLTKDDASRDEDDRYRFKGEKPDSREAQFEHTSRRKNNRREKESDEIYEGDDDVDSRRERSRRLEAGGRGRQGKDENADNQREEKEPRGRGDERDTRRNRFEDLKGEKVQYDAAPSSYGSEQETDIRKERNGKDGIRTDKDRRDERNRRGDGNARDDGGNGRDDDRTGRDDLEDSDSDNDTDDETVRRIREDRRIRREREPEDRPNDLRHNRRGPKDGIDSDDSDIENVANNEGRERERTRQTPEQIRQADEQTRKDKAKAKESRKAEADKMAERQAASVNRKKEKQKKTKEGSTNNLDDDDDDDSEMREYNTNRVSLNPKIHFWAGISILKNAPIWSSFSVIGLFLYIEITRQLFSLLSISSGSISASSPTSSSGLSKRASSSVEDLGIDLSITNSWFSNLFKSTGIQSTSLFVLISLWNIICIPLCAYLIYSTLEKASNPRQGREKTRSWIIRRIQRVLNSSLRVIIYDKHFSDDSSSGGTKFSVLRSFIKKINRCSIVRFGVFVSQLTGTILVFRQTMSLQYMSGTKSDKTFSTSSDLTWTENSLFEFSENLTEAQVFSITNFVFMILLINLSISWYTYLHPNGKKSSDENGSRSILKWISISLIVSAFVVCLLYFQEIANYLVKSQNTTSASKGATESNGMIVLVGANIMFLTLLPAMGYVVYELNKVWDRKFPEGVFNRKKEKNESSSNE